MNRLAITLCAAASVAAAIAAAGAQATDVVGVTDTEIKVGSFGPLTGPVYIYGKLAMNGIEVYFNKLNQGGGVQGHKLVLVREDDSCKPEGAIPRIVRRIVVTEERGDEVVDHHQNARRDRERAEDGGKSEETRGVALTERFHETLGRGSNQSGGLFRFAESAFAESLLTNFRVSWALPL